MSKDVVKLAFDGNHKYQGGTLLVLLALAEFADPDGKCWPSVKTIAKRTRLGVRHVRRLLKLLRADGALQIVRGGGRGVRSHYQINLEKLACTSAFSGKQNELAEFEANDDIKGTVLEEEEMRVRKAYDDAQSTFWVQASDITDPETVTSGAQNDDICDTTIRKNHQEPKPSSSEPSSDSGLSVSTMESKADASPALFSSPSKAKPQASSTAVGLAQLLRREILGNKPDFRITERQVENWARTADLMLSRDGRTEQQISDLIRWVQHDEFWKSNVLSMDKLREKFDQLEMKSRRNGCGSRAEANTARQWVDIQ